MAECLNPEFFDQMQCQDILYSALRWIGVLAQGETPNAQEAADAMAVLNEILGTWSAEGRLVNTRVLELKALAANTGTYTMGPSGSLSTARPTRIVSANSIVTVGSASIKLPVEVVQLAEWETIVEPSLSGAMVRKLYCDYAYPLANVLVWPIPSATDTSLEIGSLKPLTQFVNLTDTFDMAPGYERALRLNLGVELAPEYNRPLTDTMMTLALSAKQSIATLNALGLDPNAVDFPPPPAPAAPQGN